MDELPKMPERSVELPVGCKDLIDVELFDAGWLQVFSYSNSYQPDPDEPMLPMFTLENPSDLSNECWDRGLLK